MLARIVNDQLELGLPTSGILSDGRTVSGYDHLPEIELKSEGWKETINDNSNGSDFINGFYDNGDKIVLQYEKFI